jgi:hypothetical protein
MGIRAVVGSIIQPHTRRRKNLALSQYLPQTTTEERQPSRLGSLAE